MVPVPGFPKSKKITSLEYSWSVNPVKSKFKTSQVFTAVVITSISAEMFGSVPFSNLSFTVRPAAGDQVFILIP